jgi:endonuclease/exonuclease/phosphatase family metal-dependent hydrolase
MRAPRVRFALISILTVATLASGCHFDPTAGVFVCDVSDYFAFDGPDQPLRKWNPFCEGPDLLTPDVRAMSFNIHHGVGVDGVLGLDRIASVVRSADVDVAGLQEVDRHWSERSNFVDQATWLADSLGMHVVFGANLDRDPVYPGEPRRQYGTAILTRRPILEWQNTFLPRFDGSEQRGLLEALIDVDGVPLRIYNTHLQHDSSVERVAQVEAIGDIMGTPDESVVLVGDINAAPTSPEVEALLDDLSDAWDSAGVGDGFTYSTSSPRIRSDYVLTSEEVIVRTAVVITSSVGSDHLPVVASLQLPHAIEPT